MGKELIEFIAKSLVEDSKAVEVTLLEGEKSTILELQVAEDDIGKVIGKQGCIAKAMRTLLKAVGNREEKRLVLEILD